MTITEFLLARIAEDEASIDYENFGIDWANSANLDAAALQWHDRRMVAECAAKRATVDLHFECRWASVPSGCSICRTMSNIPDTYPCRTLRHLAAVYASNSDYDETWKP